MLNYSAQHFFHSKVVEPLKPGPIHRVITGQLPVIDETADSIESFKLSPDHIKRTPYDSIRSKAILRHIKPRTSTRSLTSNGKYKNNNCRVSRKLSMEFSSHSKSRLAFMKYPDYFQLKEEVNKKYEKLLNDINGEELVEIKYIISKTNKDKCKKNIEKVQIEYQKVRDLIKLQEIFELEDILKK